MSSGDDVEGDGDRSDVVPVWLSPWMSVDSMTPHQGCSSGQDRRSDGMSSIFKHIILSVYAVF